MLFFLYATCVAAVLFDVGTSIPVPQFAPIQICPSTHYLQNGVCYLRTGTPVAQPCSSCQTATTPISPVTPPCAGAVSPCQSVVPPVTPPYAGAVSPCQAVVPPVTPPCAGAVSPCQAVVPPSITPPCAGAVSPCQAVVPPTQPCAGAVSPCQAIVPPVTPPCAGAVSPCQAVVPPSVTPPCAGAVAPCQAVVPPVTPPCAGAVSPCQAVVPPVTQPCSASTFPCQTAVTQPQPCATSQTPPYQQPPTIVYPTIPPSSPPPPEPTTTTNTTTTTTTTSTTTAPPRPDPIIRCPIGTMLINGYCHLLYCGSGVYRDGKCIVTVCPDGTVWSGSKCEIPAPQNHTTLNISNLVITNVNQTNVNHVVNYTSNISLYITEPTEPETVTMTPCPQISTTSAPKNCCIIVTPRTCNWDGSRHVCRNEKYRRCGSICTNEYIYLEPPTVVVPPPPPPPPPTPCMDGGCNYDQEPFYPDCSSCNYMSNEFCETYCQSTICQKRRCQSIELRGYCGSYPGAIGCRNVDGCTQNWCDGY